MVRDIAYDWLRKDEVIWKAAEVKAAELWLSEYQSEENAENLQKVRGYLEAFYHYCNAEDWTLAIKLFNIPYQTSQDKLSVHKLITWGFYRETINICKKLIDKDKSESGMRINYFCLRMIGVSYSYIGNYLDAINNLLKSLNIVQKESFSLIKEIDIIRCLAYFNCNIENYENATFWNYLCFLKSSKIDYNEGLSLFLAIEGTIFFKKQEYYEALVRYKKSLLSLHGRGIKNLTSLLGNLGVCFVKTQDYDQALHCFQNSLLMVNFLKDDFIQANMLQNLGITKSYLENNIDALSDLKEALRIFKKRNLLNGQAEVLRNIAALYLNTKQPKFARQHCEQALKIATELGIPLAQECQELLSNIEEAENC